MLDWGAHCDSALINDAVLALGARASQVRLMPLSGVAYHERYSRCTSRSPSVAARVFAKLSNRTSATQKVRRRYKQSSHLGSQAPRGPVATCVGIDWRIFGRHEAIRSCGEVNDLIVWFLGEGLPSVDLAHGDLS